MKKVFISFLSAMAATAAFAATPIDEQIDIITNTTLKAGTRVTACNRLCSLIQNDKKGNELLDNIKYVEDFINSPASNEIASWQLGQLYKSAYNVYDKKWAIQKARTLAETAAANVKLPHSNRINMTYNAITKSFPGDGNSKELELTAKKGMEQLRALYKLEKISDADIASIAKKICHLNFLIGDKAEMEKACREPLNIRNDEKIQAIVNDLIINYYKNIYDYEAAVEFALEKGRNLAVADIYSQNLNKGKEAIELYKKILADSKADYNTRINIFNSLLRDNNEYALRYTDDILASNRNATNALISKLEGTIYYEGTLGDFDHIIKAHNVLDKLYDSVSPRYYSFRNGQCVFIAYAGKGDAAKAVAFSKKLLEKNRKLTAAEKYQLQLNAAILTEKGDQKALFDKFAAADKEFKGELSAKDRLGRIHRVGSLALLLNDEIMSRAIAQYTDSLFALPEKRNYVVRYSEKNITGIESFMNLNPAPLKEPYTRKYQGNMDFLITDVSTGNRGEGINATQGAESKSLVTMQVAFDNQGIHFLFEVSDEKAREIEMGLLGGGSFEGYIAPGENQPYTCILANIAPDSKARFYNTTYETSNHRRISTSETTRAKSEIIFTDNSVFVYYMISWEAYPTLVPVNGSVWDYENMLFGRTGSAAWNGTESIHGRSTWGTLTFDMPEKARIAILKSIIFKAAKSYKSELSTHVKMGIIDFWKDSAIGDPGFYNESVKPLVDKLAPYLDLVKADMSDEDVMKVADEALRYWINIRYEISNLRRNYSMKKLTEE